MKEIGEHFGIHYSNVSKIIKADDNSKFKTPEGLKQAKDDIERNPFLYVKIRSTAETVQYKADSTSKCISFRRPVPPTDFALKHEAF